MIKIYAEVDDTARYPELIPFNLDQYQALTGGGIAYFKEFETITEACDYLESSATAFCENISEAIAEISEKNQLTIGKVTAKILEI